MNNIKLYLLLTALFFGLKVDAESVFGQGGQWNIDFADNALTEFNTLKTDSAWVAQLQNLPDNTWLKANPRGIPALPSRFRAEVPMVYMPTFKAMFFTAGDGEELGNYNSDSWAYSLSANTWVQMWPNYIKNLPFTPGNPLHNQEPYPTDRPAGRCSLGLSFDTDRGKLVLHGGANTGSQGLFTWEYDPVINKWTKTAVQNAGYNRAEDNNLGFIPGFGTVEVGGDINTAQSETWVYRPNTNNWEKITTNGAPPGAHNSKLVWASKQERLIFWADFSQLWAFDPVTSIWENISPTAPPSLAGFYRHGMAYDEANDVIIMYGSKNDGSSLSMGPWVYSFATNTWQDMNPSFRPPNGSGSGGQNQHMAYDIEHNVVVITGNGRGTWVYRYKQAGPDLTPPTLVSVNVANTATEINLVFSEAVTAASAQTVTNYQISDGIQVISATLNADNKTVHLQTDNLITDFVYTITVNNIQDSSSNSNEILPNSTISVIFEAAMGFDNGLLPFGWTPLIESRWSVVAESGNNALFLNTSAYEPLSGLRLGEHIISADSYGDFTLKVLAKTSEPSGNNNADYALVFGFEDEENYFYMMFNRTQSNTQLFKVVAGARQELATATANWLIDDEYHTVEVSRITDNITVKFDSNVVLQINDSSFPIGRLGVGSYNDSVYFDDIRITDNHNPLVDLIFVSTFE